MDKMAKEKLLIKRHGHSETFDERKIYASIYAACLATRIVEEKAETIADKVCKNLIKWLGKKKDITSKEVFDETSNLLEKYDSRAAFMYKTHRDII